MKVNNQTITKEELISGKIPKSNPEISKRLPQVPGESFYKPKKNSPWNSFRIQKQKTIDGSIQKARISSLLLVLIKLPAGDKAREDQLSHPAHSNLCRPLASSSLIPMNGFPKQ